MRDKTLTPRQREAVAETIVHGSRKVAAACMGISQTTMRNHLRDAFVKLDAVTIIEAATNLGWINVPADVTNNAGTGCIGNG